MHTRSIATVLLALSAAPAALAQAPARPGEDEIVVTAERPRGSVPGDVVPETTLNAADVRSFGATSIFQIIGALAPQTGSASIRGGGFPVVLVNGRRISGFQEIRDLPPDVITRVDVFDEQLALQYGFSPNQRVVNLVLAREYEGRTVEAGGGRADGDARATVRGEARHTRIDEGDRVAAGVTLDDATSVTERERGIAAPTSGPDARGVRTLAPDTDSWDANASLSRALSERITGNASLRVSQQDQRALLGLDSSSAVRLRETESETLRATAGLDGAFLGWQWTATATGDLTQEDSRTTDTLSPARTSSDEQLIDLVANANGAFMDLPGGRVRAALRLGVEQREIDSVAIDQFGRRSANLDRTTPSGRATITAPITSRRSEFGAFLGDITLNATASFSEPSDFSTLSSIGYGASWAPLNTLRFTLQAENSEAAPTLEQLGDPVQTTPDVPFFDAISGQTVRVTRTSGGNGVLGAEGRDDITFNANWSPRALQGLSLSAGWARNNSSDVIVALPTALAEAQTAFPSRFTRDIGGVLVGVDARPINLASRDIDTVRVGFNFSRSIGGQPPQRPAGERPQAPAAGDHGQAPPPAEGPPSAAERRIGIGGGARAGGRWNVSVFYKQRLSDEVTLAPGLAPIDVLDRGGLFGAGDAASSIDFEGGLFNRGLGLRFSGGWVDGYTLPVASGGALDFSDRWTLNARIFLSFDGRPDMLRVAPLLKGSRLALSVDNLTDSFVEVRDSAGATPAAFQEGYQNPLGRVVQVSFRKQF
jgi:outer membrane cobalamin receptor